MSEKTAGQVYKKNIGSVVFVSTEAGGPRGSGVVVGDNEVVTNCHVVDDGSPVLVQQPGEGGMPPKRSPARIIASFSGDLCLLKTEGLSAPQAEIGETKSLSIGDSVYAIGNPNGIYGTLSSGIVSQVHPNDIQTTTALAGGSSGGGLFNHEGQLVGITTSSMGAGESTHSARRAELIGHLRQRAQVEAPLHDGLIAALNDPSADKFRNWRAGLRNRLTIRKPNLLLGATSEFRKPSAATRISPIPSWKKYGPWRRRTRSSGITSWLTRSIFWRTGEAKGTRNTLSQPKN